MEQTVGCQGCDQCNHHRRGTMAWYVVDFSISVFHVERAWPICMKQEVFASECLNAIDRLTCVLVYLSLSHYSSRSSFKTRMTLTMKAKHISAESFANSMTKRRKKNWQPRLQNWMQLRLMTPDPRPRESGNNTCRITIVKELEALEDHRQDHHPSSLQLHPMTRKTIMDDP